MKVYDNAGVERDVDSVDVREIIDAGGTAFEGVTVVPAKVKPAPKDPNAKPEGKINEGDVKASAPEKPSKV